jgi:hypothetical protein
MHTIFQSMDSDLFTIQDEHTHLDVWMQEIRINTTICTARSR